MEGKELLFRLSDSFGVSGAEHHLHGILREYFNTVTDEICTGRLGDLTAIKRGTGGGSHRIMVEAHGDEIGMIVKGIDERGFIKFTRVAGVDPKTLPAQEVIIHGKREVYGVIGAKPPHVLSAEEMKKAISMEDMVIDVGMTAEEAGKSITVGDFITVKRSAVNLLGDYVTGKALDDRAGICAMFEAAKYLEKMKHGSDVYFVSSITEETGFGGVRTSTYEIKPDIAIIIDVTFGDKYASADVVSECGKGVEITIGPNIHPELSEKLMKLADDIGVPYFTDVSAGHTGTDAWEVQTVGEGVPTLLISIPLRYMHTSTEVISYKDVERTGRLIAQFISWFEDWSDVYDA